MSEALPETELPHAGNGKPTGARSRSETQVAPAPLNVRAVDVPLESPARSQSVSPGHSAPDVGDWRERSHTGGSPPRVLLGRGRVVDGDHGDGLRRRGQLEEARDPSGPHDKDQLDGDARAERADLGRRAACSRRSRHRGQAPSDGRPFPGLTATSCTRAFGGRTAPAHAAGEACQAVPSRYPLASRRG